MATDDNTLTRMRPRSTLLPGPGLSAAKPPPEAAAGGAAFGDDVDPLPGPGSPYDAAFSRPSNQPETVLHVLLKDGYSKGYAWSNFDSIDLAPGDGPGGGPVLVIRFAGLVPTELRISGSNLGRLHACLGRQRLTWIREQPSNRGFPAAEPGGSAEVITGIVVSQWQPERPDAGQ